METFGIAEDEAQAFSASVEVHCCIAAMLILPCFSHVFPLQLLFLHCFSCIPTLTLLHCSVLLLNCFSWSLLAAPRLWHWCIAALVASLAFLLLGWCIADLELLLRNGSPCIAVRALLLLQSLDSFSCIALCFACFS